MDIKRIFNSDQYSAILKTFFLLGLLFVLFLVSEFINQKIFFQKKAVGDNPSFSFEPSTLVVTPGQEFLLEVKINTANQPTSGGSIQVVYNKDVFEAKQIIPGKDLVQTPPMYPTVLRNKIEKQIGKLFLDAGVDVANPQYYLGQGTFGKIQFKVNDQAPTGDQTIVFLFPNSNSPQTLGDCDIIGANDKVGQDLLAEVSNLTVTVSSQTTPTNTPVPPTPTPSGTQPTNTPTPTSTPFSTPSTSPSATSSGPSGSGQAPTPKPTLPPFAPDLIADISGPENFKDRRVDIYDFNALMVHWGETQNIFQFDISGPQNQPDGKIDFYDLAKILVYWIP